MTAKYFGAKVYTSEIELNRIWACWNTYFKHRNPEGWQVIRMGALYWLRRKV